MGRAVSARVHVSPLNPLVSSAVGAAAPTWHEPDQLQYGVLSIYIYCSMDIPRRDPSVIRLARI